MGAAFWTTVLIIIWRVIRSNICSSFFTTSNFISYAFVMFSAPVVFTTFFSVFIEAGSISIVRSTYTEASFGSCVTAVTFISTFVVNIAPNFVFIVIILTTVFFTCASVFTVWGFWWATWFSLTFVGVFAPFLVRWATVFFTLVCVVTIFSWWFTTVFSA